MAQCWPTFIAKTHPYRYFTFNTTWQNYAGFTWRSFLSSASLECLIVPKGIEDFLSSDSVLASASSVPSISCFCDDDPLLTEHCQRKDLSTSSFHTRMGIVYSPWATSMMNGYQDSPRKPIRESTGGPTGGGRGNGDGGGDDGGDGDDEGNEEQIWVLPLLTISFAAFHLGYCVAVWVKEKSFDLRFFLTGIGLFCQLAVAAVGLNNRSGIDAYFRGFGASIGVMLWTGEHCLRKRKGRTAGIVSLLAASMAAFFSSALYDIISRF
ncbi:hypothetical protein KP509_21G068200 [Ceratopteris richardii]|uniref:Uncharacterized protein n=1 Tax=Ceratopteris richardii TaxID=49495 RepID=A0A8T2SDW5_CERRI|nr:hypothetical protein KP509_21G068200 [Ceratopteris richardii]KAH7315853.1 hypothetical protein KP509_21G068200 [Ceratopteris richardii]KAH7315854.1 hypothetical protein KP509_21G068200 [Ceratopteris richardii]KAH7315855.1 hypothetical protein KP509_21G068200 [Ceratopteris richardii]KAH7315856.1 hypothetical protein KP509_21G068200 [Ceratopteris richardii]